MSESIVQFSAAENWQEVWDFDFVASDAPYGRYYPIPPMVVPILLTSPFIALAASSTDAQSNWRLGYWARQYIAPTGVGGALEGRTEKAFLNRFSIARFPLLATQYQLRIEIPWWHKTMSIGIWEYTGPISESDEQLITDSSDLIRIDLLRIEAKINQLLQP